ncbi:helix-turn-helix transcriptional regulator [Paenibacillus sinopodophylli]|uniref:helix-turn-helix transcriptional regulator n=1 Tax=Paenibacillus sinopodophylli TaxID=1837342 RepID=UPI00110CC890|nr:helix-turn-helix transcriptional regulator [Paenibacillus sinopodophylli]
MTGDVSYTTEDIARLLQISKLTVYDLIKKGELPSYRVGKQMRVDPADLEAYKQKAKGVHVTENKVIMEQPLRTSSPTQGTGLKPIVITGQDLSLDILAKYLELNTDGIRPLRAYVGSLDSLISMYRGESDIVSTHLLDGDTGEYNLPYIKALLVGSSYIVVNLLSRNAGMYVQKGNPLSMKGWSDLSTQGLRIVNREKGAGARVLLDEQLRLHGIKASALVGYDFIQSNHLGVASKVASGAADVGIGVEKAASIVGNVDFIPLIEERYDLVMLKTETNQAWITSLLQILRSDAFRNELQSITGYDLTRTGEILMET